MEPLLDFFFAPTSGVAPRLAFAIDVALRATLVFSAAALASVVLRRNSPSVRHLVWASALAGALALPFLMLALPVWGVPVLPAPEPDRRPPPSAERSASPHAAADLAQPVLVSAIELPRGDQSIGWAGSAAAAPGWRPATTPVSADNVAAGRSAWPWALWLMLAWGAGSLATLAPLLVGRARLRRLSRRSARLAVGRVVALVEQLRHQLRVTRRVVLLQGDDAAAPMTWGALRPVILLPAGSEDWPEARLRAVLLHELAHVRRWDCLTQLVARLACAVYWFHPLAWLAASRLRVERERACDDLVLATGARPSDYAGHLLAIARRSRPTTAMLGAAAVPMARPSGLEGRVRAILDTSRSRRILTRRGAGLLLAAASLLLLLLATAQPGVRTAEANQVEKAEATADGRLTERSMMTINGQVLAADGRPVPGAHVAIVGRRKLALLNARANDQHEAMGRVEADAEGRFRLDVPRTSSVTHYNLHALAAKPGFGLGWTELNRDAESPSADLRLGAERTIEGQLVDLQGAPAAGVQLRVSTVGIVRPEIGGFDGLNLWQHTPEGLDGVWPTPVVTDAEGRFRLGGVGQGVQVRLRVDDPRFARQGLSIEADEGEGEEPRQVTLALQPAMRVSGRVTAADTGEPLRDAIVVVGSGVDMFNVSRSEYHTDADGRYEANPAPGAFVKVTVYPPTGSPYPIFERNFTGNEGLARREVGLEVPRGVLLTGRVTERGTGRPLPGASVYYENGTGNVVEGEGTISGWMAAIPSDADGRYAIAVMPGTGYLLFYGPTADFVHEVKGSRELYGGKPGGDRYYAHAFVPYEVEPGQEAVEIDVALTPGATLKGRVEGPDGQAVDAAEIITTLSISPFHTHWRGDFTIPVRDSRFELHGVPADHLVKCSFLDAKNGWGATLEVTSAMAVNGPLAVTLEPCGAATARFVDEDGEPVEGRPAGLNIVATPGPGSDFSSESLTDEERSQLNADEEIYANVDRLNYWEGPRSDADGRITLPKLIPGATYRVYEFAPEQGENAYRWRDFTIEPGATLDLGDIRVKTSGD